MTDSIQFLPPFDTPVDVADARNDFPISSSVSLAASARCGGVALLLAWGMKAFVCLTLLMIGKNAVQGCTADVVSVRDLSSRVFPAFPHGYDGASLLGICFRRCTTDAASCAGGLQASFRPLADDALFQLGHDSTELKNCDPHGRGCVYGVIQ